MPRSLSPGAALAVLALALAGALTVSGPAGAASNLQYRQPLLPIPAGRAHLPKPKPPVQLLPTRPAPIVKYPTVPIGPAKLPPQKTYPYAPGTVVNDHRHGKSCSYVVGNAMSWCQYWSCEHPGHRGYMPPPPWPYPSWGAGHGGHGGACGRR
jgi:hypothetical protein